MTTSADYAQLAQQLSIIYTGRPAEAAPLLSLETQLLALQASTTDLRGLIDAYETNPAVATLIDGLGKGSEAVALFGSYTQPSQAATYINAIYQNLFGRVADSAGLAFWSNALTTGIVTAAELALQIAAGALTSDATIVVNKTAIASAFEDSLASAGLTGEYTGTAAADIGRQLLSGVTSTTTLAAYLASVDAAVVQLTPEPAAPATASYTLTTGVDHISAAADSNTITAILDNADGVTAGGAAATLNATDVITGRGVSTLTITDYGLNGAMSIPSGATVTGITSLNISTLEGISDSYSGWSKLTAINVTSADGDVAIVAPTAAALTIHDTAGAVTTTGGSTVTVSTDTNSQITVNGGSATRTVALTGGIANVITDTNYNTGNANTIGTVSLAAVGGASSFSYTLIESDALTALTLKDFSAGAFVIAAIGTRALTLTLDNAGPGYVSGTGAWVEDNTATTLNVKAVNNASSIYIEAHAATALNFNDSVDLTLSTLLAADATAISIKGAGDFSADLTGTAANAVINASTSSGALTVTLAAAQSFTGGAGQDIVTVSAAPTALVKGGSAANNEIILTDMATASETTLANVQNFTTLGIAGTTGSTYGLFDMTGLGYTVYDVKGAGGDLYFTGVLDDFKLYVGGDVASTILLQVEDAHGATDSATVTLGTTDTTGISLFGLTLQDSTGANHQAVGNVTLVSNAASSSDTNMLTVVSLDGAVTLDVTGSASTEIQYLTHIGTGTLEVVNDSQGDLTIDHLAAIAASYADLVTSETLTLTNNSAAAMKVAYSTLAFSLETLNLNGNVGLSLLEISSTDQITVNGATDDANVSFEVDDVNPNAVINITLGDGDNVAGSLSSGEGALINITLGSGSNMVSMLGDGVFTVGLAAHAGTDTLTVGAYSASSFSALIDASATFVSTTGLSVVTGLQANDIISLVDVTSSLVVEESTNLAGVANQVELAHGTYSESAHTFTYDANGTDTLLTYDSAGQIISLVLAGYDFTSVQGHLTNSNLYLG